MEAIISKKSNKNPMTESQFDEEISVNDESEINTVKVIKANIKLI